MMKKQLFFLFTFILAAFAFMACSSDDDDSEDGLSKSDIVGTWTLTEVKTTENGTYVSWPYETTLASFNANGTYYGTGYFGTGRGTWSKKGNVVNTYFDGQLYVSYQIISVNSNHAEMKMTIDGSSIWIKCTKR